MVQQLHATTAMGTLHGAHKGRAAHLNEGHGGNARCSSDDTSSLVDQHTAARVTCSILENCAKRATTVRTKQNEAEMREAPAIAGAKSGSGTIAGARTQQIDQ